MPLLYSFHIYFVVLTNVVIGMMHQRIACIKFTFFFRMLFPFIFIIFYFTTTSLISFYFFLLWHVSNSILEKRIRWVNINIFISRHLFFSRWIALFCFYVHAEVRFLFMSTVLQSLECSALFIFFCCCVILV